jgi:hypothetical protein
MERARRFFLSSLFLFIGIFRTTLSYLMFSLQVAGLNSCRIGRSL